MNNLENRKLFEQEPKPIAEVIINCTRHSIKGKREKDDDRRKLTTEGIKAAAEKGREQGYSKQIQDQIENLGKAEVHGSTTDRTVQTSVFRMLGEQFKDVSFEGTEPQEIVRWLQEGGLNVERDELLGFKIGDNKYKEEIIKSVREDEDYINWLLEKSDQAGIDYKQDPENISPITIQAGNIAEFFKIIGQGKTNDIVESNQENSEIVIASTSQGILESFLYKAIQLNENEETAREILQDIEGNGFDFNQGFDVRFRKFEDNWDLIIKYNDLEYLLDQGQIEQIIQERENYKQQLKDNLNK